MTTPSTEHLISLEQKLLAEPTVDAPALFILGAPRTGSTLLYQLIGSSFSLPYIDNLTNTWFPHQPILGLLLGAALRERASIEFKSAYGKTRGETQPSEGSAVMMNWFGGGHPSQTMSAGILEGRAEHFIATLAAVYRAFQRPLLIKNAWNCFRMGYLAQALPQANFIWIKRDIRDAAKSDLAARYATKGDPNAWNSATPSNVADLLKQPYWQQVVENQYAFSQAISEVGAGLNKGRFTEIWYEDLIRDPGGTLARLASEIRLLSDQTWAVPNNLELRREATQPLSAEDAMRLDAYVAEHAQRFSHLTWRG